MSKAKYFCASKFVVLSVLFTNQFKLRDALKSKSNSEFFQYIKK